MIGSDYTDGILLEMEGDDEVLLLPNMEAMLSRNGVLHERPSATSIKILCVGALKQKIKALPCWEYAEWRKDNPI